MKFRETADRAAAIVRDQIRILRRAEKSFGRIGRLRLGFDDELTVMPQIEEIARKLGELTPALGVMLDRIEAAEDTLRDASAR
jgi:hypothetical protein